MQGAEESFAAADVCNGEAYQGEVALHGGLMKGAGFSTYQTLQALPIQMLSIWLHRTQARSGGHVAALQIRVHSLCDGPLQAAALQSYVCVGVSLYV
jgi:hypothetical protein